MQTLPQGGCQPLVLPPPQGPVSIPARQPTQEARHHPSDTGSQANRLCGEERPGIMNKPKTGMVARMQLQPHCPSPASSCRRGPAYREENDLGQGTGSARHQGPRVHIQYPAQAAWDTQGWLPPYPAWRVHGGSGPPGTQTGGHTGCAHPPQTGQHSALGFTSHTLTRGNQESWTCSGRQQKPARLHASARAC